MAHIDVPKIRGRMAERGYTITSLADRLGISRNTLANYLDNPEKIPYGTISELADVLCDSVQEATGIFFASGLR